METYENINYNDFEYERQLQADRDTDNDMSYEEYQAAMLKMERGL